MEVSYTRDTRDDQQDSDTATVSVVVGRGMAWARCVVEQPAQPRRLMALRFT